MKIGIEIGENLAKVIEVIADKAYLADEDVGSAVKEAFGINFTDIAENYVNASIEVQPKGHIKRQTSNEDDE